MKRLILVLLTTILASTGAYAQQQNTVRIEIASAISTGVLRMEFGHQICKQWCISAEAGMNISRFINSQDNETLTHWNTLSDSNSSGGQGKLKEDFTEISIYAQYWPEQIHCGPMFCLGGAMRDRSGADIVARIGYSFKIWNGIRADLAYNLYIIESTKTSKVPLSGIRIGLSYVFK